MELKALIMDDVAISRALKRIAHEIVEKNRGVENVILLGVKRRGIPLAERIAKNIEGIEGIPVETESVDITRYRDDLTEIKPEDAREIIIEKQLKGKKIVIVDDVLFTGRTARAAMEAIIKNGRPESIQLAVLIDRGHRELPIRADYVGKNVPTSRDEIVAVSLSEVDGNDEVKVFKKVE